MTRVFHVPETLYQRLNSPAYTKGKGGWQNCVRELRACVQPEEDLNILTNSEQLSKIQAKAHAAGVVEGRIEGINLSIQTLRDLQVAEETEGS